MRIADEMTLRRLADTSDDAVPRCEILLNGAPSGREVSGALLEAAVATAGRFLLFTTDDVPFEDMLGLHLLDADLRPLDSAQLGGPYTTGSFSALELLPPDRVRFRYIGDTAWTLVLLPRPELRTPFNAEPAGVRRGFSLSRHFTLEGRPQPQR